MRAGGTEEVSAAAAVDGETPITVLGVFHAVAAAKVVADGRELVVGREDQALRGDKV